MKKKCLLAATALCVAAVTGVYAEDGGSPLFHKAREFYAAGQYDSTIAVIREHLRRHGRDPESLTLVPLVVEAYMRRNEHAQVHRLIDMYRQKFPESPFIPRLTYLEGVAYAKEARPIQALTSFSTALDLGISADLFNLTLSNAENVCGRSLSVDELSSLSGKGELHAVLLEIVRFFEIKKFAASGQTVRAGNGAEEFRRRYPRSRYNEQLRDLANNITRSHPRGQSTVQIGLLAPMTGEDADVGRLILEGVKLAIDGYNARRGQNPVKFIVYDTKGSPVETARRSKDLLTKDQAQVCIGPVFPNTAVVSAAMFGGKNIVMISPTANEDGISALDSNIFQMNVTLGTMARRLARYAMDNMSIREFAIIAPNNGFGHEMAEAFKEELGRRSIEVVHEEYYEDGLHDFTHVLRRLRRTLTIRRLEAAAAERGDLTRITQLTRSDSVRHADAELTVGGLFMPLSDYQDVIKLAPQVIFQRIRTQMLGAGGWNDPRVPAEGRPSVDNAIITAGFQPNTESEAWAEFRTAYRTRYNSDPHRISALGYDAANLVIKAIEESGGGTDIAALRRALASIQEYVGLSGTVSFDPQTGANGEAVIMKITEAGFIRVH